MHSQGPLRPVEPALVDWNDAGEPRSPHYHDGYFSRDGGLDESTHVFLQGNDLPARFVTDEGVFSIGELGFGTGLNFLLTARTFLATAPTGKRLHYWSVDRHPLRPVDLHRALALWPDLRHEAQVLCDAYPPLLPGIHRRVLFGGRITLDLVWADGLQALEDLAALSRPTVDAWYLDGFAPRNNPELWRGDLFLAMARASRDNATLASYSVASLVRTGLQQAGFSLSKRPGFGRKRECLAGQLDRRPAAVHTQTPWDLDGARDDAPRDALVLGAGLAGAHAAAALARRGVNVSVFDSGPSAGRASGNPQGVLFTRLSPQRSPLADFSLAAALYAAHVYRQMFEARELEPGIEGDVNGCLQLGDQATRVPAAALDDLNDIARLMSEREASEHLGTTVRGTALWLEHSGWLDPRAVCRALLQRPHVHLQEQCGPLQPRWSDDDEHWQLVDQYGAVIAHAPLLILATGAGTRHLDPVCSLPLRTVRGQTTQLPTPPSASLRYSCCHEGYVAPARDGELCIGATFDPKDEACDVRVSDHRKNLATLADAFPDWADYLHSIDPESLTGRAELRCVSPDYLPVAGPVADDTAMRERFSALGFDARELIAAPGVFKPGLYVSAAHGSRGLGYAALAAEVICSQIFSEPLPVARDLQRALAPARFLIRAIIRRESS